MAADDLFSGSDPRRRKDQPRGRPSPAGLSGGSCVGPEQSGDQDDHCPVVAGEFVEPGGDAAPSLETSDAAFDHVAAPVEGRRASAARAAAGASGLLAGAFGDGGPDPAASQTPRSTGQALEVRWGPWRLAPAGWWTQSPPRAPRSAPRTPTGSSCHGPGCGPDVVIARMDVDRLKPDPLAAVGGPALRRHQPPRDLRTTDLGQAGPHPVRQRHLVAKSRAVSAAPSPRPPAPRSPAPAPPRLCVFLPVMALRLLLRVFGTGS